MAATNASVPADIIKLRRDLHANPELAFEEVRTAGIAAEWLHKLGCEVTQGIARTGLVGVMDFGDGPMIGLRADMDALPILETSACAHASKKRGVMHACGHDGHTAILLGAASALASAQELKGKIAFIFQPAEENAGGAKAMIGDGLFDRFPLASIYGVHNLPNTPLNEVWVRPGVVSAAFDTFDITIEGKGGHGAMPEACADPIPATGALVMALNTVVSRNIAPLESAVLTVGDLHAPGAYNVIPSTAQLKGSCRSLAPEVSLLLEQRIRDLCTGVGAAYQVNISCAYERRYPSAVNDEAPTSALIRALGASPHPFVVKTSFHPVMGSEDFAFFQEQKPGCYALLGSGDTGGSLHSATYDFNDAAIAPGIALWTALAIELLGDNQPARRRKRR